MDFDVSVAGVFDLGRGCVKYRLSKPSGYVFEAGQYFLLRLGDRMMKPFSFSSGPAEGDFLEFTTKMSPSEYKLKLASLKAGDTVRVSSPMGRFTHNPAFKKVVFLAGGIGVTPFRSIIKKLTDERSDCDVILIWGVNTVEDVVFKDDFDLMAKVNPRFRAVYVPMTPPSGWAGAGGLISGKIVRDEVPDITERAFYVCGPPKMVEAMDALLDSDLKVDKARIIVEQFSGY